MQLAFGCQVSLMNDELELLEQMMPKHSIELVVARHEEDLRWLRRVPRAIRISVYNKGKTPTFPEGFPATDRVSVRDLPNAGREAHSYLTHLFDNYEKLASVTLFCQGHPFDHAPDFHERLRALAEGREMPTPFLWYGFLDDTDDPCGKRLFVPWSKNPERRELSTGSLYEKLFGEPCPPLFHFRGGAQFGVALEAVIRRPREFYGQALQSILETRDAAHSLERFWDRMFGPPVIDPETLGSDGVKYWKRIRRVDEEAGGGLLPVPMDSV